MKKLSVIAILCMSALPAAAADDFGTRFMDQTPAGFSDIAPNNDEFNIEDFRPELIEPASGDEEASQDDSDDLPKSKQVTPSDNVKENILENTIDEILL